MNIDSSLTPKSDLSTPPLLLGHQKKLHQALVQQNPKLAEMYLGALSVLAQSENPDRLALAAHGFRELMEKLPRELDLPITSKSPSLNEKVRALADSWKHASKNSKCQHSKDRKRATDSHMDKFLNKIVEFFDWFEKDRPSRKQQTARVLRNLDPMGRRLPPAIERLWIEEWDKCHDYFEGVSHHNTRESSEDMAKWIEVTETFLLDRLQPRTFNDQSKLDKIIKDDVSNA